MIRSKQPKSEIVIDLTGPDGNAFALMGYATRFARDLDFSKKEIDELMKKFNIRSNVNFIIENFEKLKKSKEVSSEKKITIKKGGLNRGL